MSRAARGALAAAVIAVASSALVAVPAFADDVDPSVVGQDPTTMSVTDAVLIFAGIPLLVFFVIWLLVYAPGWTRGGRPDEADTWTGEAHEVGGSREPAAVAAGDASSEDGEATGGTSASW